MLLSILRISNEERAAILKTNNALDVEVAT